MPRNLPARSCWAAAWEAASASSNSSRWARTAGRLSTVLVASSRAHTHSSASSSGRLQSEANSAMLAVTRSSSSDGAHGTASGYWPRVRCARWPTTEPVCRPTNIGPMAETHWPSMAAIPPVGSSPRGRGRASRRVRSAGRLPAGGGCGHRRQDGAPRLERPERPVAPADRHAGQPAPVRGDRHAGGLDHVQLRHPGQLLHLDPLERLRRWPRGCRRSPR